MDFVKKLLSILLLTLLLIGIGSISSAQAVTINFQWSGDGGYRARGSFSYEEKTAPVVFSEKGSGKMKVLDSFTISFLDSSGQEIATYEDVIGGVSRANYFQFNFNTKTGKIFGLIDLGGESAGETYLKGTINQTLSLFQVDREDSAMDIDTSPLIALEKSV